MILMSCAGVALVTRVLSFFAGRLSFQKVAVYLAGCVLFSAGAHLFIYSGLGTDPLDVFALGVLRYLPLTIGIVQAAVAAICLGVWAVWNRRRPILSPFFTFFFCGSIIDVFQHYRLAALVPLPSAGIMLFGVLFCAYASSLIIMSGLGIRAIDVLAISFVTKLNWQFWMGKALIEFLLLAVGYLLGGPVGVGTICFLLFVDGLIQPFMWLNWRLLRIPNHGIPQPAPSVL
jgi:uncharacterized membrane protein YczE